MNIDIINGLHVVKYQPESSNGKSILVISPLFDEKRSAHRAISTFSTALSEKGYLVLHPDLSGTGNSNGDMCLLEKGKWISEVNGLINALNEYEITIIAFRAGALFAANADLSKIRKLILCQPMTNGTNMIKQIKTRRMVQNSVTGESPEINDFELDGEVLSAELYSELSELIMPNVPPCDYKIIQFSFNNRIMAEYQKLNNMWGGDDEKVNTYIHEPFWNSHSPGEYIELINIISNEVI